MKFIVLTLLGLAVIAQAFRLPQADQESAQQQCIGKYASELAAVQKTLADDIEACKSSSNEEQCVDDASKKSYIPLAEITEKIRECVASATATKYNLVEEHEVSDGSVEKQCLEKFNPELIKISDLLQSELEACKTSANEKECTEMAYAEATEAGTVIVKKLHDCVKEHQN